MSSELSQAQGSQLLRAARNAIARELSLAPEQGVSDNGMDAAFLKERQGLFVTLHKEGQLRGCIGNIEPVKSLGAGIIENAVLAAFKDTRFPPLAPEEFDRIDIEVSVLSRPRPLHYRDPKDLLEKLTPFQDGVVLEKGGCRATFLPQVWEQLPDPNTFLTQLSRKAGLAPDAWETEQVDISIYRVRSFAEKIQE